jgi:hypothetical protein
MLIYAVCNDLFFAERLENALKQLGHTAHIDDLSLGGPVTLPAGSALVLADLEAGAGALAIIREARQQGINVLAFGPHTDLALRQAGLDAGATQVVAKSKLTNSFADLVAGMLSR